MRQKLPAVELLKAALHLVPEPQVVIEIVLHKLLNVFVRTAANIGSNTIKLRLQFWGEVHFHDLQGNKLAIIAEV